MPNGTVPVDVLRLAAGDGWLTTAELDQPLEAALTARTSGELVALTADLPGVPGRQARELARISKRHGDVRRTGRWVVPQRMEIRVDAGDVKLDFSRNDGGYQDARVMALFSPKRAAPSEDGGPGVLHAS